MAVQFIPLLKAAAPFVAKIAASSIPSFTSKPLERTQDPVVARQISELQEASTKNAEQLHVLAGQMQGLIVTAEDAAASAKRQIAAYKAIVLMGAAASMAAFVLSLVALFR